MKTEAEYQQEDKRRGREMRFKWSGRRWIYFLIVSTACYGFFWMVRHMSNSDAGIMALLLGFMGSYYIVEKPPDFWRKLFSATSEK